jgi:hypothetical protein
MSWIAENLNWLVPVAITILGAFAFLAFKYPEKFPLVVGSQLIVWPLLFYVGIWFWTARAMWFVSGSLVECVADASCDKERIASFANDIRYYLGFQLLAYAIVTSLLLYAIVLMVLPRKLIGK